MKLTVAAIALVPFTFAFADVPEVVIPRDPQPTNMVEPWPDEGVGYPGYADSAAPPAESINQASALDTTSVVLGALGGIALGGAALGITLVVQRRHDPQSA
ncbi:hypothetical protein ACIBL3_41485 [Kribbella sp. NPDC050124]|uniref:hypothetical protein n=1 Tax=Kribbella sp. NPDC050124 TaxID=3364114 RepID=UPI0037A3CAE7